MQTIEIEDDIYSYLLSKISKFRESESDILRRELKLGTKPGGNKENLQSGAHELSAFLGATEMKFGNATDKFLKLLAEGYSRKPKEFEKLLAIRGRERIYFARSKEEIARSGNSTQPLQIPGSPYWVMTNSPTPQKKVMLRQALQVLGFSDRAGDEAANAL